jgi:hypothetical protein
MDNKGYSHGISTQKERDNRKRAKGSPPEKNTTSKKELLTLSLSKVAEGSDGFGEDDDE